MADENDDTDTDTDTGDTGTVPDSSVDVSAFTAKIAQLESVIAERDATIADLGNQLTAAKAVNYDLLMAVPNDAADTTENTTENEPDDDDGPDIDDLFGDDK